MVDLVKLPKEAHLMKQIVMDKNSESAPSADATANNPIRMNSLRNNPVSIADASPNTVVSARFTTVYAIPALPKISEGLKNIPEIAGNDSK